MSIPSSRYFLGLVPWYSLLIALGAGLAIFLADREARRQGLPEGVATDLALVVLPCGIIGARLYYVVFSWGEYQKDPLAVFRIWEGGLAIYGGLIAGGIAALIFCRQRKLSVWKVLDLLAPGVALAQALGRWGNYFNQDHQFSWKRVNHLRACDYQSGFLFFPPGSADPGGRRPRLARGHLLLRLRI